MLTWPTMSDAPIAVLFSYDPESGEHSADSLRGLHPTRGFDPITWAYALKESIEDDFPGRIWAVTGNDEALDLRSDRILERMGLTDDEK